jgi:hypothetical protein
VDDFIHFPDYFTYFPGYDPHYDQVCVDTAEPRLLFDVADQLAGRECEQLYAVRPVALSEPFKVRTITGGPSGRYHRSKWIQKAVHGHLRSHPTFQLIGRGGDGLAVDPLVLQSELWTPGPGEFYVSGDYKSATDNLHPSLSEAAVDEICLTAGWAPDVAELFKSSLTGHTILPVGFTVKSIVDGWDDEVRTHLREQTWGQLMGSPTSFPVLCIVNAALTRSALERRYGRTLALSQRLRSPSRPFEPRNFSGILVNGDDVLFVTDSTGLALWEEEVTNGGLEPSVGKNFTSSEFCVVNSTMFKVECGPDQALFRTTGGGHVLNPPRFVYIPYVNYGLLRPEGCGLVDGRPYDGRCVGITGGDVRSPSVGTLCRDLIRGFTGHARDQLILRFLKLWKPVLHKYMPEGMSYWLPPHLGGLGIPPTRAVQECDDFTYITRQQLVFAARLAHDPERQAQLTRFAGFDLKVLFSLFEKAAPVVKAVTSTVDSYWTNRPLYRSERERVGSLGVLQNSLVIEAMLELRAGDLEREELDELTARYQQFKSEYRKLWRWSEKSHFPPMSTCAALSSSPWVLVPCRFVKVDTVHCVDLRAGWRCGMTTTPRCGDEFPMDDWETGPEIGWT